MITKYDTYSHNTSISQNLKRMILLFAIKYRNPQNHFNMLYKNVRFCAFVEISGSHMRKTLGNAYIVNLSEGVAVVMYRLKN